MLATIVASGCIKAPNAPSPTSTAAEPAATILPLPFDAAHMAAVWTGSHVIGLGGIGANQTVPPTWTFDPATGVTALIPGPRIAAGRPGLFGFDGARISLVEPAQRTWEFFEIPTGDGGHADGRRDTWREPQREYPVVAAEPGGRPGLLLDQDYSVGFTGPTGCFAWGGMRGVRFGGSSSNFTSDFSNIVSVQETIPLGWQVLRPSLPAFPKPMTDCTAVWIGSGALVFGGRGPDGGLQDIVIFDAASNKTNLLAVSLPIEGGLWNSTAIWTGTEAYLFGGATPAGPTDQIIRFRPSDGSVAVLDQRLPSARSGSTAVLVGDTAYLFGGRQTDGSFARDIVGFEIDPVTKGQPPIPRFNTRNNPSGGPACTLVCGFSAADSSDADDALASFQWDFGDGSPTILGGWTWHTFPTPGSYEVRLTVTDAAGNKATVARAIDVRA